MFCPLFIHKFFQNKQKSKHTYIKIFSKGVAIMYKIHNFLDNDDINIVENNGAFTIIEYKKDLSVCPETAMLAHFCAEMNIKKRQVVCDLNKANVTTQSGAMQWMIGNVNATSGIKGVGDLIGKTFRGKATGESAIKPEYEGTGLLILEPTYKHLFLLDTRDWNNAIVLSDGMFLACESSLQQKAVMRSNLSSAAFGGEGLFNLSLQGEGIVVCESPVPHRELILFELNNDVVKIDGNMAVAWSKSLEFTVERSGKTLIGSAASGEGLVNVYRGTGKVLMAPVI
jgi:uncharacterized protein (AIM24 family)